MEKHETATSPDKLGELAGLTGMKWMVARHKHNLRVIKVELVHVGGDLDVEPMRGLHRPQQRARQVQIVVAAARQQREQSQASMSQREQERFDQEKALELVSEKADATGSLSRPSLEQEIKTKGLWEPAKRD